MPASSNRIHMKGAPGHAGDAADSTCPSVFDRAARGIAGAGAGGKRALTCLVTLLMTACAVTPPAPAPVPPATPAAPAAPAAPVAPPRPTPVLTPVPFAELPGWAEDDLRQLWPAFLRQCRALRFRPQWQTVCASATTVPADDNAAIRAFFETRFEARRLTDSQGATTGLMTGYYEPVLRGSRSYGAPYTTPLYGVPDDLLTIDLAAVYPQLAGMRLRGRLVGKRVVPYPSRAEIEGQACSRATNWCGSTTRLMRFSCRSRGRGGCASKRRRCQARPARAAKPCV